MDTHALMKEGAPYIISGLLMLSGVIFAFVRSIPQAIGSAISRRFVSSIAISNDDVLHDYVRVWLDAHPYSRRARNFTVKVARDDADEEDGRPRLLLTPAFGEHLLRHRGRIVWLDRSKERERGIGSESGRVRETITFRMFGARRSDIETLLAEIVDAALAFRRRQTPVFVNNEYGWNRVSTRDPRPLESIILADGLVESLLADLGEFRESREWYRAMGIPFRRGVLMYGPPGTGKSSLVAALAGHFHAPLYALSLTGGKLTDAELVELFHDVESGAFVLLEDLDAAFNGRKSTGTQVSLSGLLNAVDGAAAKDGAVLFVSTNHREKLDPALVRPGRLDVHVHLDYANASQRRRIFERFFPGHAGAVVFEIATAKAQLNMAELQEFLLERRHDPDRAVLEARAWANRREAQSMQKERKGASRIGAPFPFYDRRNSGLADHLAVRDPR